MMIMMMMMKVMMIKMMMMMMMMLCYQAFRSGSSIASRPYAFSCAHPEVGAPSTPIGIMPKGDRGALTPGSSRL